MRRRWSTVLAAAALVAASGCTASGDAPSTPADPGPVRDSWRLGHRIPASSGLRVVARSVTRWEESTQVLLGPDDADGCGVSWHPAGTYGPDNMVGDKVAVEVAGRPGVRDGGGAEGPYLMWQPPGSQAWASVTCYPEEDPAVHLRVAEAVVWEPSSLPLPFDLTALPPGYEVRGIDSDLRTGRSDVRIGPPLGTSPADAGLLLSYDDPFLGGATRAVNVGGRSATLSEDARWPRLCLLEQGHRICVGAESSDTGPYPDRSAEVPTLLAVAEALEFPADLDDRSSWFRAEDVFG
jgi:hypothetical protein